MAVMTTGMEYLREVTVLYVEDENVTLLQTTRLLSGHLRQLHTARDGQEGLFAFAKYDPDIIVTDIEMPRLDGIEMVNVIRRKKPEIPVIFLTFFENQDYLRNALEIGVDRYVLKPVEPDLLLGSIARAAEQVCRRRELSQQRRINDLMLDSLPHPAMLVDIEQQTVVMANRSAGEYGIRPGSRSEGPFFSGAWCMQPPGPRSLEELSCIEHPKREEIRAFDRDWELSVVTVNPTLLFMITVDITERKLNELALRSKATLDQLTGIPNRFVLQDRLEQALTHSLRYDSVFAVLYIDLDHFKRINDSLGHDKGDLILREAAQRIQKRVRESDTVARIGGDEFCIIARELGRREDAQSIAEAVIEAVGKPYILDGEEFFLGTSVGISLCPVDASSSQELIRKADSAMYEAKKLGRNTYRFFSEEQ